MRRPPSLPPSRRRAPRPIAALARIAAAELVQTLDAVDEAAVAGLRRRLARARRIYLAGRGKSALQLSGFAMRLMHLGYAVHLPGEVTAPALTRRDLLLIGSGSGRTAALVGYARTARRLGCPVVLLTATGASPLGRLADLSLRLPAATPKHAAAGGPASILPMGSRFELALGLCLELVIVQLMAERGVTARTMFRRHANLE